ncbi:unnamed protein product, partial [Strongylus vulgaris]
MSFGFHTKEDGIWRIVKGEHMCYYEPNLDSDSHISDEGRLCQQLFFEEQVHLLVALKELFEWPSLYRRGIAAVLRLDHLATSQIVLQVELGSTSGGRPAVASYNLLECVIHQKNAAQGRASIEVPERKLVVQLSNCAPRKLNVFLKTLQAKLDIMASQTKRELKGYR